MNPEKIDSWRRIIRDFGIVLVGIFMLVYGTLTVREPTTLGIILAAGAALLGTPAVLRLDSRNAAGNGEKEP